MPRVCLAVLFTVAAVGGQPATARAQSSTAAGVQAILRGDYEAAVRILRPLAESSADGDPDAQVFVAMLYNAGAPGLPRNIWRACALYLNAARHPSAFMNQALEVGRGMRERFGPMADQMCDVPSLFDATPPVAFRLTDDHTAIVDDAGIVVSYRGEEQRAFNSIRGPNVPVPSRYTPVRVTVPAAAVRHFIQLFMWVRNPTSDPSEWNLAWLLVEIVGLRAPIVASERALASVVAAQPPRDIEVNTLVRVGVNAAGEAEFAVTGGPNTRRGTVPSMEPR